MIRRLSFWIGLLLIIGSYMWGLSGSLQHNPNTPFPFFGFLAAVNGFTVLFWVIGGLLVAFSGRHAPKTVVNESPARKRRRLPVAACIFAALFAVPALQPLIWADKTASPFGAFAEPVCLVGISAEILCLVAFALRLHRKLHDPS